MNGRPMETEAEEALHWFDYGHMPEGRARSIATAFASVAIAVVECISPGPEMITGLMNLQAVETSFTEMARREEANDYHRE